MKNKVLLPIQLCSKRFSSTLPDKLKTLNKFNFPIQQHSFKSINENLNKFLNDKQLKITLNGHVHKKTRIRPTLSFGFIRDIDGNVIQFVTKEDTPIEICDTIKELTVEESISVTGFIQQKLLAEGETAKWELVVEDLKILNESNIDAPRLDKLKHKNPQDLPPQFRYLQLRTSFFQNSLRVRSKIAQLVRNLLIDNHDFVEIETPLLFKSTPEGAREFLVPTRSRNQFYALPQSPQQYKQILMSSGFTKYFQIAKCFRDEDLRSDRQPEFTQIDLEMSFVNSSNQVMKVLEDLILKIWGKFKQQPMYVLGESGNLEQIPTGDQSHSNFKNLTYKEALEKFGIDKPDLRSNLSFINLENHFTAIENEEFPIVEICILKNAFTPDSKKHTKVPKALIDNLEYKRRKPYVFTMNNENDKSDWIGLLINKKFMKPTESYNELKLLYSLNLQPGDIIAVSTRADLPYENPTPLGKFRQIAIKEYPTKWQRPIQEQDSVINEYPREDVSVASWVVDFPLFNPVELNEEDSFAPYPKYDYSKYQSTHHPFTMCKLEDYDYLETSPLKVKGEHYDLVINGVEVGGGSRRIHDPQLQQYIFENVLKINNWELKFGHLIKALSMGCPPHAGLALGFDRLCAMIIGSSSIKDVIAFPKNQSGVDKIVDSPTSVSEDTLKEYYIKVNDDNEKL
ncbi:MSD1 [Candida jiufengensis]|uniref:MSD1 n=1 Tax=Candida jiufengensis TaxID=497108 RepID=UPI0022242944|nr:MSD1 [Candida jiufengensis]KAI5953406.1 MSD1 [Candida jiufengensis]